MIKVLLGRGSILSDVVGVDGLTYLPSLPLLSLLDGLKTCTPADLTQLRGSPWR